MVFQVSALITLAVALLIILGIFLLKRLDPDLPLVFVGVAESKLRHRDDPLFAAPVAWVDEDAQQLMRRFAPTADQNVQFIGSTNQVIGSMAGQTDGRPTLLHVLHNSLENAVPGGSESMIAVYLAATGIVGPPDRTPYLLVGDSLPDDPSTWVSFESVLSIINERLTAASGPAGSARAVVFLDAERSGTDWNWGKFDHSFVDACTDIANRLKPKRIAVISATSSGQRSWGDPRRGFSLFARSISQSLAGEGDLDDRDGVTVGEIADYVTKQVADGAMRTWSASQTPKLLTPSAASWKVISEPKKVLLLPRQSNLADTLEQRFGELDGLWAERKNLANRPLPPLTIDPFGWSLLDKYLIRLEQLAVSGGGEGIRQDFDSLLAQCRGLLNELSTDPAARYRLAAFGELGLLDALMRPSPPDPGWQTFAAAWRDQPDPDKVSIPETASEAMLTRMLWNDLTEPSPESTPSKRASWADAAELIERSDLASPSRFLETHLIRLLTAADLTMPNPSATAIARAHQASRRALLAGDLRASFWIATSLAQTDRRRMRHTDGSFEVDRQGESADALDRLVENDYAALGERARLIAQAYRLRDEVLHQIPRLTATVMSDFSPIDQSRRVERAIDAAACLTATLDLATAWRETNGMPDTDLQPIRRAFDEAKDARDGLRDQLNQIVDDLLRRGASDEGTLRRVVGLLQGEGLTDAARRKGLHKKLIDLLRIEAADQQSIVGNVNPSGQPDLVDPRLPDGRHPWIAWLEQLSEPACNATAADASTTAAGPASLAEESLVDQGERLRRAIAEMARFDAAAPVESIQSLARSGQSPAIIRESLARLDRQVRARTFLVSWAPGPARAVTAQRFQLDLQLFAATHAARTLDEYWCQARPGESAYFAEAARSLAQLRFRPFDGITILVDERSLPKRIDRLEQLAGETRTLQPRPDAEFSAGVTAAQFDAEPIRFELQKPESFPIGQLVIGTGERLGSRDRSRLLGWDASGEQTLTAEIAADPAAVDSSRSMVVHTFFRGLRRRGEVTVRELGRGITTRVRLDYDEPFAVVEAGRTGAENVVLIVDCSNSMNDRGKLDQAKQALTGYLERLRRTGARVSLIVFGHRYGWKQRGNKLVADQEKNRGITTGDAKDFFYQLDQLLPGGTRRPRNALRLGDVSASDHPDNDVEIVRGLEDLSEARFRELDDRIVDLTAGGVTPTYRAIVEAYRVLGRGRGHIVVLTDGVPKLTLDRASPFRDEAETLYRERAGRIRLSIVDFDNPEPQSALRTSFERGDGPDVLVSAGNQTELNRVLEQMIERPRSIWRSADGTGGTPVRLGNRVRPNRWPDAGTTIEPSGEVYPAVGATIEVNGDANRPLAATDVRAAGGEAFRLRYDEDRLRHIPFDATGMMTHPLTVTGDRASRFQVIAAQPNRYRGNQLELRLVFENRDASRFTPRPVDGWLEIVGREESTTERRVIRHQITTTKFENGQPVPVLVSQVDWPRWATRLSLRGYFHLDRRVSERTRRPLSLGTDSPQRLAGLDPVQFRARQADDQKSIEITEVHDGDRYWDALRIQLVPRPNLITRTLYPDDNQVTHEFVYDDGVPDDVEAFVNTRDEVIRDADLIVETSKPIRFALD